jgi:hypothetical protein
MRGVSALVCGGGGARGLEGCGVRLNSLSKCVVAQHWGSQHNLLPRPDELGGSNSLLESPHQPHHYLQVLSADFRHVDK